MNISRDTLNKSLLRLWITFSGGRGSHTPDEATPRSRSLQRSLAKQLAGLWCVIMTLLFAQPAFAVTTLKIATVSPDGSAWMKRLRVAGTVISEKSAGRVTLKFYPGGVMGDDKSVLRKIRANQLHGAVFTSGGLVGVDPDFQLYSLPLVFASAEEAAAVRVTFDDRLIAGLRNKGYEGFGVAEIGFAYVLAQEPVHSAADVRSRKVWTPDNDPGATRLLNSFGINGIPLSIADVLTGLQTGLINTIAAPPVGAIALQWYTQVKYAMDMPLMYIYGTLAISGRTFGKLSAEDQQIVRDELRQAVTDVDGLARKDHAGAIAAMTTQGVLWSKPSPEQLAEWRSLAKTANDRFAAEGFINADLYRDFMAALDSQRAK